MQRTVTGAGRDVPVPRRADLAEQRRTQQTGGTR